MSHISLRVPQEKDWLDIAMLVGDSIPNYLVSQLRPRFGAVYYQHLAGLPGSYSLAAYDTADNLAGFILGTLDRRTSSRLTLPVAVRLLLAANIRLFSSTFVGWLARGVWGVMQTQRAPRKIHKAELIILVVSPAFRGEKLAPRLQEALEIFFRQHKLRHHYFILTEKVNIGANRFYEKIGACFVRTYQHHGREINEWHKHLACDPFDGEGMDDQRFIAG